MSRVATIHKLISAAAKVNKNPAQALERTRHLAETLYIAEGPNWIKELPERLDERTLDWKAISLIWEAVLEFAEAGRMASGQRRTLFLVPVMVEPNRRAKPAQQVDIKSDWVERLFHNSGMIGDDHGIVVAPGLRLASPEISVDPARMREALETLFENGDTALMTDTPVEREELCGLRFLIGCIEHADGTNPFASTQAARTKWLDAMAAFPGVLAVATPLPFMEGLRYGHVWHTTYAVEIRLRLARAMSGCRPLCAHVFPAEIEEPGDSPVARIVLTMEHLVLDIIAVDRSLPQVDWMNLLGVVQAKVDSVLFVGTVERLPKPMYH